MRAQPVGLFLSSLSAVLLAMAPARGGETLKDIGDVLGHRSPETTFMYTKLHVEDLRTVALDPEVVS